MKCIQLWVIYLFKGLGNLDATDIDDIRTAKPATVVVKVMQMVGIMLGWGKTGVDLFGDVGKRKSHHHHHKAGHTGLNKVTSAVKRLAAQTAWNPTKGSDSQTGGYFTAGERACLLVHMTDGESGEKYTVELSETATLQQVQS